MKPIPCTPEAAKRWPRSEKARLLYILHGISGPEDGDPMAKLEHRAKAPPNGWEIARDLEDENKALQTEIDRLHALLAPLNGESAEIVMRELRRTKEQLATPPPAATNEKV